MADTCPHCSTAACLDVKPTKQRTEVTDRVKSLVKEINALGYLVGVEQKFRDGRLRTRVVTYSRERAERG